MKKIICVLIIIAMLMPHITVQAAPAASLLIPIAGAIAMLGYMGVETVVKGADSGVVEQQLGNLLLEYASYKGATIAELFPAGSLTFSLGRLIATTEGTLTLFDFAQWLMTGTDEGPIIKNLYSEESFTYNGVKLKRSTIDYLSGTYLVAGSSDYGRAVSFFPFVFDRNISVGSGASEQVKRAIPGYWWLGYRNNEINAFVMTEQRGTSVTMQGYYGTGKALADYGTQTDMSSQTGGTTNSTVVSNNGKTFYVARLNINSDIRLFDIQTDGLILGDAGTVTGGMVVEEETIDIEGELKYPTKIEDGEVVPDVNSGTVVGIPDLPLDQSGEEAAGTIIDLVTDAPLDTTKYGDGSGGDDDEQDPIPIPPVIDVGVTGLEEVFPFSIPFDIYYVVTAFVGEPLAPNITLPLHVPGIGDYELNIDLSPYENVAIVLRSCELILVILGLIILTNRVVR